MPDKLGSRGLSFVRGLYLPVSSLQTIDGAYHADSVTTDDRRQNRLVTNDWYVLRFARGDLSHPNNVAEIIAKALIARGVRIGRLIRL